jgi:hypothetical protein
MTVMKGREKLDNSFVYIRLLFQPSRPQAISRVLYPLAFDGENSPQGVTLLNAPSFLQICPPTVTGCRPLIASKDTASKNSD